VVFKATPERNRTGIGRSNHPRLFKQAPHLETRKSAVSKIVAACMIESSGLASAIRVSAVRMRGTCRSLKSGSFLLAGATSNPAIPLRCLRDWSDLTCRSTRV
jgi:hypothetical protein